MTKNKLVLHGTPTRHGVSELALLHVATPHDPITDAARLFAWLEINLPRDTFDGLAEMFERLHCVEVPTS